LNYDSSCNDLNSDVKQKVVINPTYLGSIKSILANNPHTAKGSDPFIPKFVKVCIQ